MAFSNEYKEAFQAKGFDLQRQIGSGLSGSVFKATQRSLGRHVAIKVFDNPLSETDTALPIQREARLLARIAHPSIPVVLTRGELTINGKNVPYTIMQFIDGIELREIIENERRIELTRAVGIASQVLAALGAAHTQQIVHRDVKPANIMVHRLTSDVHLIDFSIGFSLVPATGLTRVTEAKGQPGSYEYMAPEQKEGLEVDHRADIYSLGIVLFEMLIGHPRVKSRNP
jgi:eukaryotic-like serine/threonine-protein kinase